jgi:hypothetical protein
VSPPEIIVTPPEICSSLDSSSSEEKASPIKETKNAKKRRERKE